MTKLSSTLQIYFQNQHAVNSLLLSKSSVLSHSIEKQSSSDRYLSSTVRETLNTSVAFTQLWTTVFFKTQHFSKHMTHRALYVQTTQRGWSFKRHQTPVREENKINMPVRYGQSIAEIKLGRHSPFSKNMHNYYNLKKRLRYRHVQKQSHFVQWPAFNASQNVHQIQVSPTKRGTGPTLQVMSAQTERFFIVILSPLLHYQQHNCASSYTLWWLITGKLGSHLCTHHTYSFISKEPVWMGISNVSYIFRTWCSLHGNETLPWCQCFKTHWHAKCQSIPTL